ncbi:hypothetical protein EHS25_008898 [Saitozyma podzolica]|uniref:DNA-directed RNA polymerase III subunit n=1 Tax=Saitozyma podzolica TaxID=1890683 RepID=A0A427YMY1_9TREE|nr:hypothetical protein EHS25_008898 [Saitozyma podzolica]
MNMPGMPKMDVDIALRGPAKHSGVLYPPLETNQLAYLPGSSQFEDALLQQTNDLDEMLAKGLYELGRGGERAAPWRLPEARKVVGIEIESYADRIKPESEAGPSKLEPLKLKMDERFFPPELWSAYFGAEEENRAAAALAAKKKARKRKRVIESDDEENRQAEDAEQSSAASSGDADSDFSDESDHQDYEANYFDNGEGDDDEGGDEDEGGGGGFDD